MEKITALARELHLAGELLPRLEAASASLPPLPLDALADPASAGTAWTSLPLPGWEEDDGLVQLAAVLTAANTTRDVYRRHGIADEVFLSTMGCLPRFLEETKQLFGRYAFDRGFWTWRQIGCRLFRLGALEFEYVPGGQEPPALHVHIPSDAPLSRDALDDSYAQARRFFAQEGAAFCFSGPPQDVLCDSWLLAPALDSLLPETSGIRRFARDFDRLQVWEDDPSFYRWLFQKPDPVPTEELPEDTSLQRAVKARLAAGGTIGVALGRLRAGLW